MSITRAFLLSAALFATAASAQAPMAAKSTQEIIDSEFGLVVLQLQGPVPQNVFRTAGGKCPNGGEWLPNYICTAWNAAGSCTRWEYAGHSCQ